MEKKKILIIEDEAEMRALLTLHLQFHGYEVSGAMDGEHGLKEVKDSIPDLIILDVMLPGIGGYEVCERLKTDKHFSDIPILMFSARAGDIDKTIGFRCGADDYLPKPFEDTLLMGKIERLLERHGEEN